MCPLKWNNIFKTKFLDEIIIASLRPYDAAVKDLSDVVFSVAEATLPVKSGLPVLKKPKNFRKRKNKWLDKSCFELEREVLRFGKLTSKIISL